MNVRVTAATTEEAVPSRSIVIRAPDGALLLAVLDLVYDVTDETPDTSPLSVAVGLAGCPGSDASAECDPGHAVMASRTEVGVTGPDGSVSMFDGNAAQLSTPSGEFGITVERARDLVCWDDGCAGDDSGPFSELRAVIVAQPGG